jgi:hypothetical protein
MDCSRYCGLPLCVSDGGERGDEISSWKSQRTTWPQFVDKGKYSKMPKLSVQAQMEEFFYRELVKYLKLGRRKAPLECVQRHPLGRR